MEENWYEKSRNRLVNIMKERGFVLTKIGKEQLEPDFTFINTEPEIDIIVEVKRYYLGLYEFVYTNDKMFGILRSGDLLHIEDNKDFDKKLFMFLRTVDKLRG